MASPDSIRELLDKMASHREQLLDQAAALSDAELDALVAYIRKVGASDGAPPT